MPRPNPPTDAELDAYILTRYALIGVDISVLPASDPDAPMDRERLLRNGREILRQEAIAADYQIDPQFHVPTLYPAQLRAWTREETP